MGSFFHHKSYLTNDVDMMTPENVKNIYTSYAAQRRNVWNGNPMRASISHNDESSVSPSPEYNSIMMPGSSTSMLFHQFKLCREIKKSFSAEIESY